MLVFTDYLIIAAYFLLILVVGALTGRKQEKEDFLISGRKLTSIQATTTIFSSRIGAAILLTYTALVYMYGMGALWYFIGSVFGLFMFLLLRAEGQRSWPMRRSSTPCRTSFFFLKGTDGRFPGHPGDHHHHVWMGGAEFHRRSQAGL
jgi:Na+/proline symporter